MLALINIIFIFLLAGPLLNIVRKFNLFVKKGNHLSDIWTVTLKKNILALLTLIVMEHVLTFIFYNSYYIMALVYSTLAIVAGWLLLAFLFYFIRKINSAAWIWFFYYVGQVLTLLVGLAIASSQSQSYGYIGLESYFTASAISLYYLSIAILFCSAGVAFLALITKPNTFKTHRKSFFHPTHKKPSRNMLEHYQAAGLSKQEIEAFRSQMADSRKQIINIEANFQKTAKMRAIEIRHNIVKVSKNYFKDIVEEPNRRLDASDFLINYLPQLDDLLEKYNEINSHVAKNKQSYLILEKSAQTIDQLSQEIVEDYLKFHSETYQELEDGLKLADRMLHNESNNQTNRFSQNSKKSKMDNFDMDDPFEELKELDNEGE
ncbi:5-bromo-4-chloroindolyl phosphate hydrolysis family protein [Facklamia sp. P13064]|uniref:5-bromo-4-chloroindolyl phosphate hydrolysis family protein n=1 Tax=unclassified Facklamia TaxID=2622293 RepID=UPI003D182EEE